MSETSKPKFEALHKYRSNNSDEHSQGLDDITSCFVNDAEVFLCRGEDGAVRAFDRERLSELDKEGRII